MLKRYTYPMLNRRSYTRRAPWHTSERLAFVDRACSLIAESRYAPGWTSQLMIDLSDDPQKQEAIFYDLTEEGAIPSYPIAEVGNCPSRTDMALGLCLASRWVIRDAALAGKGYTRHGGPSP